MRPILHRSRWRPVEGWHVLGYCAGWAEAEPFRGCSKELLSLLRLEVDRLRPFRLRYHTNGHSTAAEAAACYHEYLLDTRLLLIPPGYGCALHACDVAGCNVMTSGQARILGMCMYFLCPGHWNRQTVAMLLDAEAKGLIAIPQGAIPC